MLWPVSSLTNQELTFVIYFGCQPFLAGCNADGLHVKVTLQNESIDQMDQMNDYQEPSNNIDLKQYAIDHVVDGIYWMDEQSRILEVNDGACRMVGYSREELTSMTVGQLNPVFRRKMARALGSGSAARVQPTLESFHRHKDGHLINVEITANFIVYHGRELICSFVRDITERKAQSAPDGDDEILHGSHGG